MTEILSFKVKICWSYVPFILDTWWGRKPVNTVKMSNFNCCFIIFNFTVLKLTRQIWIQKYTFCFSEQDKALEFFPKAKAFVFIVQNISPYLENSINVHLSCFRLVRCLGIIKSSQSENWMIFWNSRFFGCFLRMRQLKEWCPSRHFWYILICYNP